MLVRLARHLLLRRQHGLHLAEVDETFRGSLPCWTTPETMSPSRPANSPNVCSSSASRRRCRMTCLAVVAAIRPKPLGVSSNSRRAFRSSSVSAAHTVTCPVLRSSSTRASAGALGAVVGDEQGRLDRLDQQVEGDLLLPLQPPQGAHVDVHAIPPRCRRLNSTCTRPRPPRPRPGERSWPSTSRYRLSSTTVEPPGRALPPSGDPAATSRPAARRQCRGSVSGRSTPGEPTSRT